MDIKSNFAHPLVTIVTITRNLVKEKREAFAKACIESVHFQSYPYIEHIIIDGASEDGTLEFLQSYVDKGYLTVYSEPDQGIYDAMNKGLARAKGKYINFLNTDDFFHNPLAVEVSVQQLESHKADYSFANAFLQYPNGKKVVWTGNIMRLAWASHYCHQTMFVRSELLRHIGGFNTDYKISADTEMMIHLYAMRAKYVKVDDNIVTYRAGGYSSQNQLQSRLDHSKAFYTHIGQYVGLTQSDCFLLWNKAFIDELSRDEQLELVCKVHHEYGQKELIEEIIFRSAIGNRFNKKYYLFGFLPVMRCKQHRNNIKYLLFSFFPLLIVKQ